MSLDDVINLSITSSSVSPTRLGFGTPLCMVLHSTTPNTLDIYGSLTEMVAAGFATTSPAYRMATKLFAQNPRPRQVVIGKRTHVYTQVVHLYPLKTDEGYHYRFSIVDHAGVQTDIDYTVLASATIASIVTALTALIDPVTDLVAVATTSTHIVCTATAGKLINYKGLPSPDILGIYDKTADAGIVADMQAVEALDSTTWYAVLLDAGGRLEAVAAAAHVETMRKIMLCTNSDSDMADPAGVVDLAYATKAAAYARTGVVYSKGELLSYSAAALVGKKLPTTPGRSTWAYSTLAGVTVDILTTAQINALKAKNANWYAALGGVNVIREGKTASGEWIDTTHFVDWLYARMQERLFAALASASAAGEKIPYTQSGIDTLTSLVSAQLKEGVAAGGLAATPAPAVTAPDIADIDPAEKIARNLPGVRFSGTLAGAIHTLEISGILSV